MDIPWAHILERAKVHIGMAPYVIAGATYGFWWLGRNKPAWKLRGPWRYLVPWMASLLVIIPREAFDVWRGGHIVKSVFDMAEWGVFLLFGSFVLRWYSRHFPED